MVTDVSWELAVPVFTCTDLRDRGSKCLQSVSNYWPV